MVAILLVFTALYGTYIAFAVSVLRLLNRRSDGACAGGRGEPPRERFG